MPRGRPKAKPKEEAPATESLAANAIEGPCEEVSRKLVIDFSDEVKGLLRAIIVAHEALAREAEACKEAYIKAHSAGPIRKFEVPIADVFIEPSIDGNPPSEKKKEEEPNVPVPEPVPAEPVQDTAKTLDLASLDINRLLAIVSVADTTQQVAMVVDGAFEGEAWYDLEEREQFINAVRMRYVSLSKMASSGGRIPAFEKKMAEYVKALEEDKAEVLEMKKWDEEELLKKQKEESK
jgi:hypothetical protein